MTNSPIDAADTAVTASPRRRFWTRPVPRRSRPPRDHRFGVAIMTAGLSLLLGVLVRQLSHERRRRRLAEADARDLLETLTHLNRRAVVDQLSASLTHQLGQPLAAILRNAEAGRILMASTPGMDPRIQEIIEEIHRSDIRASEIIRSMRSLLKKRDIDRAVVDMNQLTQEMASLVAGEATQKGIEVDLRTSGHPLTVAGDRVHLEQVLLNLMINSIEALSSADASIRRLAVRTSGDNGCVTVSVSDTGPGIPHALLARIFDPFFTTKPEGMGIGLSISRSIIEAHDGGISAENDPQGGAAMRFWLPRCQGEAEAGHGHGADSVITEGRRSSG
jgi:C4-dicarboxylate-specific signal transduction histidine kinase